MLAIKEKLVMNQFALGVDIGGTHITAAVVDLVSRNIIKETIIRRHVDSRSTTQLIILEWSSAMLEASGKYKSSLSQIGIAMPGPFDYEKGIALMRNQGKYDALYGTKVNELLAQDLKIEINNLKFQNDAACFLLGEAFAGAARSYSKAIGLTLGTGLGSTSYTNGVAIDADLWNIPFHKSIAEEYLSSRWFVKRYQELTGQEIDNVKSITEQLTTEPSVHKIFTEFGTNLALFLKHFVKLEKPDVIILGGNISKAYRLFEHSLKYNLHKYAINLPVKLAELGEDAALLGASSLWRSFDDA